MAKDIAVGWVSVPVTDNLGGELYCNSGGRFLVLGSAVCFVVNRGDRVIAMATDNVPSHGMDRARCVYAEGNSTRGMILCFDFNSLSDRGLWNDEGSLCPLRRNTSSSSPQRFHTLYSCYFSFGALHWKGRETDLNFISSRTSQS